MARAAKARTRRDERSKLKICNGGVKRRRRFQDRITSEAVEAVGTRALDHLEYVAVSLLLVVLESVGIMYSSGLV